MSDMGFAIWLGVFVLGAILALATQHGARQEEADKARAQRAEFDAHMEALATNERVLYWTPDAAREYEVEAYAEAKTFRVAGSGLVWAEIPGDRHGRKPGVIGMARGWFMTARDLPAIAAAEATHGADDK